jgi:hypothetical protein
VRRSGSDVPRGVVFDVVAAAQRLPPVLVPSAALTSWTVRAQTKHKLNKSVGDKNSWRGERQLYAY